MDNHTVKIFVKWVAKPNKINEVLVLLQEIAKQSRAETGNISYQIYLSKIETDTIFLVEEYTNAEAVQAHKNSFHYQEFVVNQIIPLLDVREVHIVESI